MVHFLEKWVLDHILKFSLIEILVISNILTVFNIFLTLLGVENRLINEVNEAYIIFRTKYHSVYLINTNSITFHDKFGLFLYNEFHQINHFIKILNGFLKYKCLSMIDSLPLLTLMYLRGVNDYTFSKVSNDYINLTLVS